MKKFRRIYLLLAAIIVTAISIAWYVEDNITFDQAKSSLIDIPSPPPASLDALYPPKSEQPLYMFAMLSLDMPFTGILVDLTEEDFENVAANYQKFKEQYISVSKMVPEWGSSFPMLPVEELEMR